MVINSSNAGEEVKDDNIKKVECCTCTYYESIEAVGHDCIHPDAPDRGKRGVEILAQDRTGDTPLWCPRLELTTEAIKAMGPGTYFEVPEYKKNPMPLLTRTDELSIVYETHGIISAANAKVAGMVAQNKASVMREEHPQYLINDFEVQADIIEKAARFLRTMRKTGFQKVAQFQNKMDGIIKKYGLEK